MRFIISLLYLLSFLNAFNIEMVDETEDGKKNQIAKDGKTIYKPLETKIIKPMSGNIVKPIKTKIVYPVGVEQKEANLTKEKVQENQTKSDNTFASKEELKIDNNNSLEVNIEKNFTGLKEKETNKSLEPVNIE